MMTTMMRSTISSVEITTSNSDWLNLMGAKLWGVKPIGMTNYPKIPNSVGITVSVAKSMQTSNIWIMNLQNLSVV